jgi:hypothetical protein
MIDQHHSTADSNLVAIDVAKDWNVALVQEPSGRRRSFKFANQCADHNEFIAFLRSLTGPVQVAFGTDGRLPPEHRLPPSR